MYGIYVVSVAHCVSGGCEYKLLSFIILLFCIDITELDFNKGNNEIEVKLDWQLINKFADRFLLENKSLVIRTPLYYVSYLCIFLLADASVN